MNSVVHHHSQYATAFGIAGVNILPVGIRGRIFAPRVPILDYEQIIKTPEEGEMVKEAIGQGYALILKNHGAIAVGDTIENACMVAFALEETAQLQWIAAGLGLSQKPVSSDTSGTLTDTRKKEYFDHVWAHYEAMDPFRTKK